jgi:hypothetical protein
MSPVAVVLAVQLPEECGVGDARVVVGEVVDVEVVER